MESVLAEKLQTLSSVLQSNQQEIARLRNRAQFLREQVESQRDPELEYLRSIPGDEMAKLRELVRDNRSMNQLIKQYENTMDVIMTKFRTQTNAIQRDKIQVQRESDRLLQDERLANEQLREENLRLSEQLHQSINVIRHALRAAEEDDKLSVVSR